MYAFGRAKALGVDIEHIRADIDVLKLAAHTFSPREVEVLASVPAQQRTNAFFRCWTRKEAYVKARGEGLSIPLDSFSVSFLENEVPGLVDHQGDPSETERWTIRDVSQSPETIAAVVAEGRGWQSLYFRWPLGG